MGNKRIELSSVDEADSYEIDEAHIEFDATSEEYILRTASGCSCWDGEYDEERFPTLAELEKSLVTENRSYNPSLRGACEIVKEARIKAQELNLGHLGRQDSEVAAIVKRLMAA